MCLLNPVEFLLYPCVVDISSMHASDGVFVVERIRSQLFGWCEPHPHPATNAIYFSTLAHQTLVNAYIRIYIQQIIISVDFVLTYISICNSYLCHCTG